MPMVACWGKEKGNRNHLLLGRPGRPAYSPVCIGRAGKAIEFVCGELDWFITSEPSALSLVRAAGSRLGDGLPAAKQDLIFPFLC